MGITGIIIDTLLTGTLVSAVTRPEHKTIAQYIPHLEIVIESQVSSIIMSEEGVHLSVGVRFEVSSVEGQMKRVKIGGERRHWWSVIRQQ